MKKEDVNRAPPPVWEGSENWNIDGVGAMLLAWWDPPPEGPNWYHGVRS